MSGTPEPPEATFHRNIRGRYPRGWADLEDPKTLDRCDLRTDEVSVLVLVRDALNLALPNAKMDALHYPCGPWHFDYIDADESGAESFAGDGYSFIGLTIPMAKEVFRLAARLRSSRDVWNAIRLDPSLSDQNSFQFLVMFLAMMFITTHEYCHHVLGHQPDTIAQGDLRTASLRGNLQAQTREVAADGYAAMHLLEHVIGGGFRGQMLTMVALDSAPEPVQDQVLFLFVLVAVAATWYRHRPTVPDAESVYRATHPPRAARLHAYMEHAMLWCRGFRPALVDVIDGQYFANLMYVVGLAVCERPEDADSSLQNAFLHSPEGREYARQLLGNLDLYKSLMGR